jgi:hypothetical protein
MREGEGEEEEKWRAPDDAFGGDLQALIYKKKALCMRDIIILLVFVNTFSCLLLRTAPSTREFTLKERG